jgi:hypothetical protein
VDLVDHQQTDFKLPGKGADGLPYGGELSTAVEVPLDVLSMQGQAAFPGKTDGSALIPAATIVMARIYFGRIHRPPAWYFLVRRLRLTTLKPGEVPSLHPAGSSFRCR